jgi:hypothetical protein
MPTISHSAASLDLPESDAKWRHIVTKNGTLTAFMQNSRISKLKLFSYLFEVVRRYRSSFFILHVLAENEIHLYEFLFGNGSSYLSRSFHDFFVTYWHLLF